MGGEEGRFSGRGRVEKREVMVGGGEGGIMGGLVGSEEWRWRGEGKCSGRVEKRGEGGGGVVGEVRWEGKRCCGREMG